MFHVDLLTPYRETEFHGANYAHPPPDLVGEEEQYEVEKVLDKRNYGCWKKIQYLVKWKGYPDSDNQWLDAKDMENAQELIAEFHSSNQELCSHIRRALERPPVLHSPSSTLSPTLNSTHMSNAAHTEPTCHEPRYWSATDRYRVTLLQRKRAQDASLWFPYRFRAGRTTGISRGHSLVQSPECGNKFNQAWESCTTTG